MESCIDLLKSLCRFLLPIKLREHIYWIRIYCDLLFVPFYRRKIPSLLKKLSEKDKITVVFFAESVAMWKFDTLYRLMQSHPRFNPIIVLAPQMGESLGITKQEISDTIKAMELYFTKNRFSYVNAYLGNNQWLDVNNRLSPDLIFYSLPYSNYSYYKYNFWHFSEQLFCYASYGAQATNFNWSWNLPFHNCAWKLFYSSTLDLEHAKQASIVKGKNVVVVGNPMADVFFDKARTILDPWKIQDKSVKRIIWAPHHSISYSTHSLAISNFLCSYQMILDMAKKFKGFIQIAFKPHPALRFKLYNHPDWGRKKTDDYYREWQCLDNGQLEDGDYIDLFLTSDAMIHDSASFLVEYLYTLKPAMFLTKTNATTHMSKLALQAYSVHYQGSSQEHIEYFIENVVLKGNDTMLPSRRMFSNSYLTPIKGNSSSKNIFNDILKYIKR